MNTCILISGPISERSTLLHSCFGGSEISACFCTMYSHSLDLVFDLVKALFELGLAMVCIWFDENSLKENLCEILKGLIEDFHRYFQARFTCGSIVLFSSQFWPSK